MPKKQDTTFTERQMQLNNDLKSGNFKPVYLVYGDQSYLRLQNRDRIRRALMADGDEMNFSRFSGDDFDFDQVRELAETLPFFADRRVILIEDAGLFGSRAGSESDELAEYLPSMPETTHIIFAEESADKRKKLYKAVQKTGTVLQCDEPDPATMRKWTYSLFKREGKEIPQGVLRMFLEWTGEDMQNIVNESEKLISYLGERSEVRPSDIRAVCSVRIKDRIFDMIEAISMRDREKALQIYMDLIALQTPPQIILSLMIRQFNQLLQVSELITKINDRDIASRLHVPPFVVTKKYRPALRGTSGKELQESLAQCLQADQDYKSGRVDARIAVEMIIVKSCEKKRAPHGK